MTFDAWKEQTRTIDDRARRIRDMIADKAERAFCAAFGHQYQPRQWGCFHLAHNWQTLPDLTPAQRQACRYVLHLERKQWEPSRLAERISRRMWEQVERVS